MPARRILAVLGWGLAAWLAAAPWTRADSPLANGPFANWAVIIVAGDWHAHSGAPSQVFDNARRDLARRFVTEGFSPDNISQFSARPASNPPGPAAAPKPGRHGHHRAVVALAPAPEAPPPLKADPDLIRAELGRLAAKAGDGCLIYVTSHGSPLGVAVGEDLLPPGVLGAMVDQNCKDRPTIAIISACFSGVFVPALQGPDRMVLTAARPDRSSFGCGEADRYTYFDGCVLQSLSLTHDFAAMADAARGCVARREAATGARPPSEPQLDIGAELKPMLPLLDFAAPPSTASRSPSPNAGGTSSAPPLGELSAKLTEGAAAP